MPAAPNGEKARGCEVRFEGEAGEEGGEGAEVTVSGRVTRLLSP